MSYRKVLVGIDASPTARLAFERAMYLAGMLGSEMIVGSAHERISGHISETEELLLSAVKICQENDITAEMRLQVGRPEQVIPEVADVDGADLLVVGNKGMVSSRRFLLSSIPARIVENAHCDVLIVNTTGRDDRRGSPSKVLVATDGSPRAEQACRKAFDLARMLDWTIDLVFCGFKETAEIILGETVQSMGHGVQVEKVAASGEPAEKIPLLAEERGSDLIIMGTRGATGLKRKLGSVSNKVAHNAPCDLLIVRSEVRDLSEIALGSGAVVPQNGKKKAIYRDENGSLVIMSAKCTHLGCTVAWNDSAKGWDCACHGSRFDAYGEVVQGPASKALRREGSPAERPAPVSAGRKHTRETIVIIGGGVTGGNAAADLREMGFDGRLVLIGDEAVPPYDRPPLSKQYLRDEQPLEDGFVRPARFFEDNEIEARFGERVTGIDDRERTVQVGGQSIAYSKLLIATGGRPRRPPIPGIGLPGVHMLRTAQDADAIRSEIAAGLDAVVVGMGFIGCEAASALRMQGIDVHAIEGGSVPLERIVGLKVGAALAEIHSDYGLKLIQGDAVAAFEGSDRVERVITRKGKVIDCEFAIVGLGIDPNVEILAGTDVLTDNGVLVDEYCRTNVQDIYAAGDVANHFHPLAGTHLRVEHWRSAVRHGKAAAAAMLGKGKPFDEIHWLWSDQYDHNLQFIGFPVAHDQTVVDGSLEDRSLSVYHLKEGRLVGCFSLNRGGDIKRAEELIRSGRPISEEDLRSVEAVSSADG